MHYTTIGKPTTDRTRIGLIFAKEPPEDAADRRRARQRLAAHSGRRRRSSRRRGDDAQSATSRCGACCRTRTCAGSGGATRRSIPTAAPRRSCRCRSYDFDWQTDYVYQQPLKLPKGTKVHATAWHDNSAGEQVEPRCHQGRMVGRSDVRRDDVHGADLQPGFEAGRLDGRQSAVEDRSR